MKSSKIFHETDKNESALAKDLCYEVRQLSHPDYLSGMVYKRSSMNEEYALVYISTGEGRAYKTATGFLTCEILPLSHQVDYVYDYKDLSGEV